jgi:Fe-Mn family superoxide dismutase
MKKYEEIKKLSFQELKGISSKAIENHYGKLYQGYVKKYQEIQDKLRAVDMTQANATFSDLRELKVEESFALNAIILHEAYFDILGGDGTQSGKILEAIVNNFGSVEKWEAEFRALGLCSRGWVVLYYDFNNGKLRNGLVDAHNLYGIWGTAPILVLDMYEHAYFMDFGADKKSYIEIFFQNLNWAKINDKLNTILNTK